MSETILNPLYWLEGTWEGSGIGQFPTIEAFKYHDQMIFKFLNNTKEPLIHFEEKAWIIEDEKPAFKHWETGFFRPINSEEIELQVTHNTGRIEVLKGNFDKVDYEKKHFTITFQSTFLRNVEGLANAVLSHKHFTLKQGMLYLKHSMSTHSIPEMTTHLNVELQRQENPSLFKNLR